MFVASVPPIKSFEMINHPAVHADNEWSPLKTVIVGRAGNACFPALDPTMRAATMPLAHQEHFKPQNPFPPDIVEKAEAELDTLASILKSEGVRVYRPLDVDWLRAGGYTGAMPRDGLMAVGRTLIEALFAWPCRAKEIELAFKPILEELARDSRVQVIRRPADTFDNPIKMENEDDNSDSEEWAISNKRPAFDTADFMRFDHVVLGQYSHVTNAAGIQYVRECLPAGYNLEILKISDPSAMHIDATILPLRQGLLIYHPYRVTEAELRSHDVLADWDLRPFPFVPKEAGDCPLFMTSPWLSINVLVLDGVRVIVEAQDHETIKFYESLGMRCIRCPFRHVNSIGGSFHCATVDLVRT